MIQIICVVLLIASFIFGGIKLLNAADSKGVFGGGSNSSKVMGVLRPVSIKPPIVRAMYGVEPPPVIKPKPDPIGIKPKPIEPTPVPMYGVEPPPVIKPKPIEPPLPVPMYGVEPPPVIKPKPDPIGIKPKPIEPQPVPMYGVEPPPVIIPPPSPLYGVEPPLVIKPIQPGDVNGDGKINSIDATLVPQFQAGLLNWADFYRLGLNIWGADANGDGRINQADADLILQIDAGLVPPPAPVVLDVHTAREDRQK